ncbi:GDSL-type esterase/lipase family protein [Streptomyces sp. NPDC046887]|uniref:GDSL-type esterase/lipase family protein n=1 Tax=Streptomyces sp. NPDC046887 TaxID=3155472 RepID=UPI0033C15547
MSAARRRRFAAELRRRVRALVVMGCLHAVMTRPLGPAALRVPNPGGTYGTEGGTALPVLLLGDSLALGVGVRGGEPTVGAQLATALAEALRRPVRLRVRARTGSTAKALGGQVRRAPDGPGAAVIVIGGNDAVRPVRLRSSARHLGRCVTALRERGWTVTVLTCPDYRASTGLRRWIRRTAVHRADRLRELQRDAAATAGAEVITPPTDAFLADPSRMFCEDGCHPSAEGYAAQVAHALPSLVHSWQNLRDLRDPVRQAGDHAAD